MTARTEPTSCLLHHDFHIMTSECWRVTVDWYTKHLDLPEDERRNAYQAAVERGMLDSLPAS